MSELPDQSIDLLLQQLSSHDAVAVLRLLMTDPYLGPMVVARVTEYLNVQDEGYGPYDVVEVAFGLFEDLNALQAQDVWERSGHTPYGSVDPTEAADQIFQGALDPYRAELDDLLERGLRDNALYYCMGLLQGLYHFEHDATTDFKDWATDIPLVYAEETLGIWLAPGQPPDMIAEQSAFIEIHLPQWIHLSNILKREQ